MIHAMPDNGLRIKAVAVEDNDVAFASLKESLKRTKESALGFDETSGCTHMDGYDWKLGIMFQSASSTVRLLDYAHDAESSSIVKVLGEDETHVFILKKENKKHEKRITWGDASGAIEAMLSPELVIPLTASARDVVHATVGASMRK